MAMKYFRDSALEELRLSVPQNLDRYRSKGFGDYYDSLEKVTHELPGDFEEGLELLSKLRPREGPRELFDIENSELAYEALENLKPTHAREDRIWTYLCHFNCLEYVRSRWPIYDDDEKAVTHIQTHFFARTLRSVERDNGVSRLWWMGMLAGRAHPISRSDALEVLLYRADVRAQVMDRPTTGASSNVFSAIIGKLKESYDGQKSLYDRKYWRPFMQEINSAGGVLLLESLGKERLDDLLDTIIRDRLGLSEI